MRGENTGREAVVTDHNSALGGGIYSLALTYIGGSVMASLLVTSQFWQSDMEGGGGEQD